jgi:hypothetical protein
VSEPTITCPNCKSEIRLTESLAAPLLEQTKAEFRRQLSAKDAEITRREEAITKSAAELEQQRSSIEAQIAARLDAERSRIVTEETERAKRAAADDIAAKDRELLDTTERLKLTNDKLATAQKAEAELLKKSRELDDAKREMELTIQRAIGEGVEDARTKAKKEAEDAMSLKVREKEEQISGMQRQIEELKRRAEQGSQQLQGEVQELVLEEALRARFPFDVIEPVAKGVFGGDVLQRVVGAGGQPCGSILWETKRTKAWSDGWLTKLRDDKRAAKADLALLVSQSLPKDLETFDLVDGVWVTGPKCAMAVAMSLREALILMSTAKLAGEGQQTKMAMMYDYLTGAGFRHRIEAIVERFTEMNEDLDRERKAMTKMWAKREQQIQAVVTSTAGLYGDLQGIAGKAMIEIEALEMPLLADERGS